MSKLIAGTGLAALLLSAAIIPANSADVLVTNGRSLNGVSLNGVSLNGRSLNGVSLNGVSLNGKSLNGISLNRISLNGVSLNGKTVNGVMTANGTVEEIVSVELPDGTVYTK